MSLARQIRRLRKGKEATASRKRRKPIFEPLEPRLLLDADLSFGMTADADDLTLKLGKVGDVDKLQIINTNTSVVLDSLALSGSTEVEIIGSDEDDVLRLDLDFDSLLDSLSIVFQGGTGFDTLDFSSIKVNLAFVATQSGGVTVTDGEYTVNEDGPVSISGGTSTTTGSGVENIIGGKGDNTYVFEDGAALAGAIDGGTGGNNSLDYSAYSISNPVVVDLSAGIATGTGGVSHIQNVIGGLGDDTLTGNDGDNILSGGPGNDTLSGLLKIGILDFGGTMRQNLLVSNGGQITLAASVRKRLGIQSGGIVTLEERDNVVVLRPAAVVEIETYSDGDIAQWDKEDRLEPAERKALLKRLRK